MDLYTIFYERRKDCPWYDDGHCTGEVVYNQHIAALIRLNDPRYSNCEEHTCPIFFWCRAMEGARLP